ncbi:Ig-like domain-containing protein [Hymenobacter daeguensis]
MKQRYAFARFLHLGAGLLFFLLLAAPTAWAQTAKIYYTQGSSTATLDAAKAVNPDGSGGTTLASAAASFAQPTDIVYDKANGYIYVTDQYVGTGGIVRFTTAGTGRTVIVPPTAGATYNGLALDATANRLYFTQGSATNASLDALKWVNLSTLAVTTLASGAASFTQPTDLALDAAGGLLYVADQYIGAGGILRFTTAGASRTVVVPAAAGVEYSGLALDAAGNRLFFTQGSATATLDALQVVSLNTGFPVTSLASGAANFTQPTDLAYDAVGGQLYLTDQFVGTGAILRYAATGTGRTVIVPATAGATYNGLALASNAAPVVTTSGGSTLFTQSLPGPSTPVAVDPAVAVTDADNATLASATVSITTGFQSGQDVLAFTNTGSTMGNIAGSYSAGVLTLTSSGATATLAQWQAALRAITYTNTASAPNTTTRTVSFVVNDGAANSNTATKNITLAAASIAITSVSVPANSTYRTGQNLDFTVNFAAAVVVNTGGGIPTLPLSLNTGGTVAASYLSGSGTTALVFRYTVVSGNLDNDGVAVGSALVLNGGTVQGSGGQTVLLTLNSVGSTTGVLVDGVAPTVTSINRQTPATALTNAGTLVYRVTFSEAVNGVGPTDFSLTSTGTAGGSIAFATLVSSGVYDVTVNSVSGDGTLRLDLNSSGTGITDVPGNAIAGGYTAGQPYTLDHTAPTVSIGSTAGSPTTTSPIPVTVTFSEGVTGFTAAGVTVGNGTLSGFSGSGTTYTLNITPAAFGTVTVNVAANVGQDAAGNGNSAASQFSIVYSQLTAAVTAVTRNLPALVATPAVTYTVTFSASVTGVSPGNFSLTTTGLAGASVTSVAGSGTTYTVTVSTGTGDGTLRLNVANDTGLTPSLSNVPYTTGDTYNVVKTFSNPVLTLQGTGGNSGSPDVTAFVDVVQIQQASNSAVVPNAVGNPSFETYGPLSNGNYGYNPAGAVWTFNAGSGIALNGSAFNPPFAPDGTAVAFIQSSPGNNGAAQQALAVGAGTYQVNFQVAQRNCCSAVVDQAVNVLINGAYLGAVQPPNNFVYNAFTSIPFIVTTTATTWTGNLSTDWFANGNWTAGVPTPTVDALIPAGRPNYPVLTTGTASALNLTLAASATLAQSGGTLDLKGSFANSGTFTATGGLVSLTGAAAQAVGGSGQTHFWSLTVGAASATLSGGADVQRVLTLAGGLATNGNPFTLLSNATGTALVVNSGGTVVGNATVQRYIDPSLNAGPGYRHYSSPVVSTTVADLTTSGFTPVVNPAYNISATPTLEPSFPTVFGYDQARLATTTNNLNAFDKGWFSPNTTGDPLAVGRGYTVNIGANQLVDFVGTLNNGDQTLALSRNSGATAADAGWALVGNPYPAPLDYSLVAPADRPNLDAALYVFSSTSQYNGQYRAYVNGVGGNPVVPVAQGFFVRVSSGQTSGSLTLRNSQRLTAPNATAFQRGTATDSRARLQLAVHAVGSTLTDEAFVYFEAGATAGVDSQYDAVKLPNSTGLNISTTAAGTELAINGLPIAVAPVTVPLTVRVPATGSYVLSVAELVNFGSGAQPLLHDLQLGTFTDLSLQPTYTFALNATSTTPRFELVFGRQALGTASAALAAQVAVFPNPASKTVFVELPAALGRKPVAAALVDALGRVVVQQVLPAGAAAHALPLANVAAGVYALRLQTEAGLVVKKLVVE